MVHLFIKGILVYWTVVNAKFNGFWSLPEQSKFERLTLFRGVNQESLDYVLVTVAH